jgi:hypothetical protein
MYYQCDTIIGRRVQEDLFTVNPVGEIEERGKTPRGMLLQDLIVFLGDSHNPPKSFEIILNCSDWGQNGHLAPIEHIKELIRK